MKFADCVKLKSLATPAGFREKLQRMGLPMPCDDVLEAMGPGAPEEFGSPCYNPHLARPALYPPSDGYHLPEDPLVGVMRHLNVVRELKQAFPELAFIGSGYTYLQEFLPYVAQAAVRAGWTDSVGLGRMVLAYPELPADVLVGRPLQRKRLCRTFSDCTTAPRHGLVSGCYPLDAHYKKSPEMVKVAAIKKATKLA